MERKNSHQVNHDQKSLPSKTECLMKSISGSFGILVYHVYKQSQRNFDAWILPDMALQLCMFSGKGLSSCSHQQIAVDFKTEN